MTDDEKLLKVLKQEETDSSSYYTSDLAKDQAEALERYTAEPYGDELPDKSKVTTQELADHIDWLLPELIRVFTGSEDMLDVTGKRPADVDNEEEIKDYLQHVFFQDNPGESIVHDFLFDGLLQRVGVISVDWDEGAPGAPRIWKGVHQDRLDELVNDSEYEILQANEIKEGTEFGPVSVFDLKVQRTAQGRCVVECVPPEEFRISKRAKSIMKADYVARRKSVYLHELANKFPKKKKELLKNDGNANTSASESDADSDPRNEARFKSEDSTDYRLESNDTEREKATLIEEYVRYDYDGDGFVEWRRVKRVENVILENDHVDGPNMQMWTPLPISHKAIGRSIADRIADIQRIRTVTTRQAMDNLDLILQPKTYVNEGALEEGSLDQMLDNVIGSVIGTTANPREVIMHDVIPDVTPAAYQALEYWDQQAEVRSGVSRHSQGLNPDALNKTATGIDLLQTAANARKEFYARQAAPGFVGVFKLILRCVCAYQDTARQIQLSGKFVSFDPRRWSDDCAIEVHVGQGIASRERRLINLNMIAEKQKELLMVPGNPLVSIKEYGTTLSSMVEEMGYKDTTRFIKDVPEDYQEPEAPPQEDPAVVKAKGDLELAAAKQQQMAELDTETTAAEQARKDAELEADMARKERQLALEMDLRERQVAAELAIAREAGLAKVNSSDVQPGGDAG